MSKKSRIAKNIRDLRCTCGETQKELGRAINVEENTISMYESGKRQPDMQKIQAIARHYDLPVDRLINDDFSQMDFKMDSMTWDKMIAALKILFPIICSDSAMQNQHFVNGYKRTQEIWKKLKSPHEGIMSSAIERALEEYESSLIDNPETIESAANMLWLIFINYALMPDEHSVKMGEAVLYGKSLKLDFVKKYVLKDSNPINKENATNKKEFVKDSQEAIMALIRILKKSTGYPDLADYYIAIRYVIGMIDNEYSDALNKTIGMEMLTSFAELGNKYALNLFRKVQSF